MLIRFQGELSQEDYTESVKLRDHLFLLLFPLIMPLILVPALDFLWQLGLGQTAPSWIILAVFYVGLVCWFYIEIPRGLARNCATQYYTLESWKGPRHYEIQDDLLIIQPGESDECRQLWSECRLWKANDKIVVIFYCPKGHWIIPRRWFASDGEFQDFKDLLTRTIGPAGRARKRT